MGAHTVVGEPMWRQKSQPVKCIIEGLVDARRAANESCLMEMVTPLLHVSVFAAVVFRHHETRCLPARYSDLDASRSGEGEGGAGGGYKA